MSIDVIILAAGKSTRMDCNKLLYPIGDELLIEKTINVFSSLPIISKIFIVTDDNEIKKLLPSPSERLCIVKGGKTRTESVKNALKYSKGDIVLIHDGARPFVSPFLITSIIENTKKYGSAIPAVPLPDSIRRVDNNQITDFVGRESFCLVQTPQGFKGNLIREAYTNIKNEVYTDDSEVFAKFVDKPFIVDGEISNKKITYKSDLPEPKFKVGNGFDLHKLQEGLPLVLGGVLLPHHKGLVAHSDGDVLVHAIMDSLLSAIGQRDIGYLFPDTDSAYKNISSMLLLKKVKEMIGASGATINNISATIIAEKPRLMDFIPRMIANIATALAIKNTQVSISATTTEGVGDIGKQECISVYAVCSCY